MSNIKISEIREVIDTALWAQDWYTGGTSEEFRRQQVGPALQKHVEALKAIHPQIKERFARDLQRCTDAIESLNRTIDRWNSIQLKVAA